MSTVVKKIQHKTAAGVIVEAELGAEAKNISEDIEHRFITSAEYDKLSTNSFGTRTGANGQDSFVSGQNIEASGICSSARGMLCGAGANYASVEGICTIAGNAMAKIGTLVTYGELSTGSTENSYNNCTFTWIDAFIGDIIESKVETSFLTAYDPVAKVYYSAKIRYDGRGYGFILIIENIEIVFEKNKEYEIYARYTNVNAAGSHTEGCFSMAGSVCAHAEGYNTKASGADAHAEGNKSIASGTDSHAEGYNTLASNLYAHAEGTNTQATGNGSHAEGSNSIATGTYSHVEGNGTTASGGSAHAEGSTSKATGSNSHAEGSYTEASGNNAHAAGYYTKTLAYQYALGHHNDVTVTTAGKNTGTTGTAFIIGNGTASAKSNAFRIDFNGQVYAKQGTINTGADYAEYFEWEDGNLQKEDRVGKFVTFGNGRYIKIAAGDDYILGVVSGNPAMIGNGDECWYNRYIMDEFNRFITEEIIEEVDIPVNNLTELKDELSAYSLTEASKNEVNNFLNNFDVTKKSIRIQYTATKWRENPEYDPTKRYEKRSDRPEWDAIGMIGVLAVLDDGTSLVNGYCKVSQGGIATAANSYDFGTYRVIERVAENIIKIVFR